MNKNSRLPFSDFSGQIPAERRVQLRLEAFDRLRDASVHAGGIQSLTTCHAELLEIMTRQLPLMQEKEEEGRGGSWHSAICVYRGRKYPQIIATFLHRRQ